MRRPVLACAALLALVAGCRGEATEEAPDTRSYVALGDSYTAAPLVPEAYDAGGCLRSHGNYPSLVAAARDDLELTDVSCTGAGTMHLTGPHTIGATEHPPQLDALDADADLVTVGIGGNDDGVVGSILGVCQQLATSDPDGSPCASADRTGPDPVSARLARLNTRLVAALAEIRERAPQARVVLVGYPQVVPAGAGCAALGLAAGDVAWARALNASLALTLRDVAQKADVDFVDTWDISAGHDVCSADPWINGATTDPDAALAFHPFAAYEQAVADLVLELL